MSDGPYVSLIGPEAAAARLFRLAALQTEITDHEEHQQKVAEAIAVLECAILRHEAEYLMTLPEVTCPVTASALRGEYWYKSAFKDIAYLLLDSADSRAPWPLIQEYPGPAPEGGES